MITSIDHLLYQAEATYLSNQDLTGFREQIITLEQRLEIYEIINQQEASIFKYVAQKLIRSLTDEPKANIERALRHWLSVTRYCSMAMLINNPDYLQLRILDWLPEQIAAHDMIDLEKSLVAALQNQLQKHIRQESYAVFKPFLEQAITALLTPQVSSENS